MLYNEGTKVQKAGDFVEREADGSTRNAIIRLFKLRGELSVAELAQELRITEMAVRRHLNVMERDRLLSAKLVRQPMGRPMNVYSLTEQADDLFPKKYHHLAIDLLEELTDSEIDSLFKRRKEKLYQRYEAKMRDKSLAGRVKELAMIQNANGYMVEFKELEEGRFELSEYNCPISKVAWPFQQACACELALFRELLEAEVSRTECLSEGGRRCVYRIEEASTCEEVP